MCKDEAIIQAKQFRVEADALLQRMKDHKRVLLTPQGDFPDIGESIAQHTLSIRDLESVIMRQGMVLKTLGTPNPYPNSRDTSNTVVDATADGLKL